MATSSANKAPILSDSQFEEAERCLNGALEGYYGLNALIAHGRLGSGLIADVIRCRVRLLAQDLATLADALGPPAPFGTTKRD